MTSAIETQNSTEELPIVSIIIPSYNQGEFIERTLLSVIKQSYPNIEIIVADGGSKDQTVKILERYSREYSNITWFSEKDEGYADAVNKGLKLAKGSIIGIQSSDDYYNKDAINEVVTLFQLHPETKIISGRRICLNIETKEIGRLSGRKSRWFNHWDYFEWRFLPPQDSTFVKKSAIAVVGGLKKEVDWAADTDLWMRILSQYPGLIINRIWSFRQYHDLQRDSMSKERFGNDCRKSVELWLNSSQFPKKLLPYANRIKSFGILRQADYYYKSNNKQKTRELILEGLKLNPSLVFIGPCQKYCQELNITPQKTSKYHICSFFKKLPVIGVFGKIIFNCSKNGLLSENQFPEYIDLPFDYESNENPYWYKL